MRFCALRVKMKLGGTTKLFVLLDFSNRTFLFALIAHDGKSKGLKILVSLVRFRLKAPANDMAYILIKGGTIMEKLNLLISYKALTQVIVPAFTFGFFPAGK